MQLTHFDAQKKCGKVRLQAPKKTSILQSYINPNTMKMKTSFLLLACLVITQLCTAQLKTSTSCPPITVDIMDGSVNKMRPESPWAEIYAKLPCFTEAIEEPAATGCAGVFLRDKGINFYTYRDYIEITDKFTGTMTPSLLGTDHNMLLKTLGLPQQRDLAWDAYQMRYGVMVVFFGSDGKINRIILSSKNVNTLRPCD